MGVIDTNLDTVIAELGDEDEPFQLGSDPLPERRGRKIDQESRRFNQALHRIAKGDYDVGGVCHELAVLTGLTPEAIRSRIAEAEWGYPPEELDQQTGLTSDDKRYIFARYGRLKDPAIRAWLQSVNGTQRRDPDHENPRVARQRITKADGTTKLISVAIDPSRN